LSEDKKEALAGIEAFNKLLFMWNPSNRSEPVPVKAGVNSRPSGTFQPYIDKLIAQCKEILNEINDLSNIYRKVQLIYSFMHSFSFYSTYLIILYSGF
jgi:hypothetical protein